MREMNSRVLFHNQQRKHFVFLFSLFLRRRRAGRCLKVYRFLVFFFSIPINESKETFKVAVRIVDLWFVQTREKFKHVEMILMDGKKDKIHAIVKREDLETWET